MKRRLVFGLAVLWLFAGGAQLARAQEDDTAVPQKLELTAAQRQAIYTAVIEHKTEIAPQKFATSVGADVPPMIELYTLPDVAAAADPAAKFFKYTMVENEVVVVDPTRMRVIDRISPAPQP